MNINDDISRNITLLLSLLFDNIENHMNTVVLSYNKDQRKMKPIMYSMKLD